MRSVRFICLFQQEHPRTEHSYYITGLPAVIIFCGFFVSLAGLVLWTTCSPEFGLITSASKVVCVFAGHLFLMHFLLNVVSFSSLISKVTVP